MHLRHRLVVGLLLGFSVSACGSRGGDRRESPPPVAAAPSPTPMVEPVAEAPEPEPEPEPEPAAAPAPRPQADPSTRALVESFQEQLRDRGYDPGPIDGRFGPQTREAIRQYQADLGTETTGQPDVGLLASLYKPDRPAPPEEPVSREEIQPVRGEETAGGVAGGEGGGWVRPLLLVALLISLVANVAQWAARNRHARNRTVRV